MLKWSGEIRCAPFRMRFDAAVILTPVSVSFKWSIASLDGAGLRWTVTTDEMDPYSMPLDLVLFWMALRDWLRPAGSHHVNQCIDWLLRRNTQQPFYFSVFFFCLFFFYGSNSWSPSATRWPNRLQVTRGRHDDVAMFTFIDATKRKDQSALGYLPHPP